MWPGIIGIEMEGAGTGLAVYRSETQPEFLMIKAICDWADNSKSDVWQNYAGHASAAFAFLLLVTIRKEGDPVSLRAQHVPQRTLRVNCTGPDRYEICESPL